MIRIIGDTTSGYTLEQAKELGIETITPQEKERMLMEMGEAT